MEEVKDLKIKKRTEVIRSKSFEFKDNHKAHVSFETCEFLRKLGINTYDWPPQSPEWNPIEYVWRDMKAYIA
jgi:transposase